MYGGDGFWMFDDPADPNYIYAESQGGTIGRVNRKTHESRDIQPKAGYNEKLRWNWNTPIAREPDEKGTIYIGAQFLFRSRDHGQSWDRISPDLTHQRSGEAEAGGIRRRHRRQLRGRDAHDDLLDQRIAEAGRADLGRHRRRQPAAHARRRQDTGATSSATSTACPKASWVSWVQASRFDAGTAYVAFDRHTFGDMAPYVYKTTRLRQDVDRAGDAEGTKGVRGYVHVIKQDPVKPNLLYAGTEFGLWISIDGGGHWAQFKGGDFPAVAVRDIAFQARDADWCWPRTAAASGSSTTSRRCARSTPRCCDSEAAFLPSRPVQQRMPAFGGWAEGDADLRRRRTRRSAP